MHIVRIDNPFSLCTSNTWSTREWGIVLRACCTCAALRCSVHMAIRSPRERERAHKKNVGIIGPNVNGQRRSSPLWRLCQCPCAICKNRTSTGVEDRGESHVQIKRNARNALYDGVPLFAHHRRQRGGGQRLSASSSRSFHPLSCLALNDADMYSPTSSSSRSNVLRILLPVFFYHVLLCYTREQIRVNSVRARVRPWRRCGVMQIQEPPLQHFNTHQFRTRHSPMVMKVRICICQHDEAHDSSMIGTKKPTKPNEHYVRNHN